MPIKDICVIWYETLLTPKKIMKKKNFFFNSLLYYGRLKSPLSIPQSKNFLPLKLREILLIRTSLYKITPKFHFRLLYQGKFFFLFRLAIHIYVIKVGIYHISFFFFSYKKIFYLNETKFEIANINTFA